MSELAKIVGQRIRNYRTQLGLSQEKLAELAGCHPTYIGQLERGEKNATLESIDKIASSLKISLSRLFENLGGENISEGQLELITENYEDEYNGYFAIISKGVFMNTVMNKKVSGKISLGV